MKKMKLSRTTTGSRSNTIPLYPAAEYYDGTGALKQPMHISECLKPFSRLAQMPDRNERLSRLLSGEQRTLSNH